MPRIIRKTSEMNVSEWDMNAEKTSASNSKNSKSYSISKIFVGFASKKHMDGHG